jgi:hypothetical protein
VRAAASAGICAVRLLPGWEHACVADGYLPERGPVGSASASAAAVGVAVPGAAGCAAPAPRGGAEAADVADGVIAGLDAQAVARCLALPAEPQRLCVVLIDVAGYTAPAEALGCPEGRCWPRFTTAAAGWPSGWRGGVSHGRP